ncbi:IS6 family transposase [Bacillus thuringiensis serovar medellin]|uniref:IS6 family transposase n=2 Tax=Bacillus thuringiensis TaxID=1428 RepID=A0A9X6MNY3_BACTV|nr:IS6 family transposase [Bacillus thuringiensis]OUB84295.1 IS6 family transposase [Bacillus thuringiensis serovar medellin]
MGYFKGKQFKKDIILVAVGYYCRFSLSYRDVSEILKERGVSVHHVWHVDETYIKVKGEWCYLYRAIDGDGYTLDFQLRKTRDHQAAYAFIKRLMKQFGEPTVLTTDQAPALLCAFKKLKKNGFYVHTTHCTVKHLNNLIEQDHRHVKRRFAKSSGFQNIRHASRTLKGIETIHAIYKQKRSQIPDFSFSTYKEL